MGRKESTEYSDLEIFQVCERFFQSRGENLKAISDWLQSQGHPTATRETVYPLVRKGLDRGFIRLIPPQDQTLQQELSIRYPFIDFRVFNTQGKSSSTYLASAASELALELIRKVDRNKNGGRAKGEKRKPIHIGLASGATMMRFAQSLAQLLRATPNPPPLCFHALNSGFAAHNPESAAVAFFSYFADIPADIHFVGLFAPAVTKYEDYENLKGLVGVKDSYELAKKDLDIVVSSLGHAGTDAEVRHAFFLKAGMKTALKRLERAGWVGDVMWRWYSKKAPIIMDTGLRAVALFELKELREFVESGKDVLLICGPCRGCGQSKSEALRPLLENRDLRIFNHLVTDIRTADDLLAPEPAAM